MSATSKIVRIIVVVFSLTLLAGYVVYSHVTPNFPPPDPFGLKPEAAGFDGFVDYGSPVPTAPDAVAGESPAPVRPPQELRIISSKVINQPIFSVRHGPFRWRQPEQTKELEIEFGQFGVEVNGKRGRATTNIDVPHRRPSSFWQRLFGRKQANQDQRASPSVAKANGNDHRVISSTAINNAANPARDPKVVETILQDNGTALAKSGKLLTPESIWDRLQWHSTLMSSSKSGPVFRPRLFDLTQPLLKTDMPIKP